MKMASSLPRLLAKINNNKSQRLQIMKSLLQKFSMKISER
jgi:hypothetical protein